jgi:hypothetical protein
VASDDEQDGEYEMPGLIRRLHTGHSSDCSVASIKQLNVSQDAPNKQDLMSPGSQLAYSIARSSMHTYKYIQHGLQLKGSLRSLPAGKLA